MKISKEGLTKTLGSGIETYCATPERNDSATVEVCLIVPKDDTVKVVSFDAPNDLGWRRSARAIVESIKPGRRVQWGGTAKLGVNMLKLQLDNAWSLELKESSTFTYRLLRRAEFGQVGPSCDLSLNFGRCKDDSALAELHGKLAARMTCDGSHCDAQIDKISDYCVVASCDAVATQSEQLELQTMLKSVDRSPEPRGR